MKIKMSKQDVMAIYEFLCDSKFCDDRLDFANTQYDVYPGIYAIREALVTKGVDV